MNSAYRTILERRTIRRFKQSRIPRDILKRFINAARLAPSAANLQPLEYLVIDDPETRKKIFPYLRWAGYIWPCGIPRPEERPVVYIAVLANCDKGIAAYFPYDVGAAAENIILAAWEKGIGVCWIKSLDKKKISMLLKLPKNLRLDSVLALGYRAEMPKQETLTKSIKYWKDSRDRLHVPKRKINDVLHINKIKPRG